MYIDDKVHTLNSAQENCLDVLHYWHRLEFFSPFDLDDALSRGEQAVDISFDGLNNVKLLPWLHDKELFHYQLFILPFDKNQLTSLCTRFFPNEYKQENRIEIEERLEDEGLTCFARLFINKYGQPKWSDFSVSTLPWAMGMLQSDDFDKLSQASFDADMRLLKSAVNLIEAQCDKETREGKTRAFDGTMLSNLLKILCQWARFSPDYPFVLKIQPIPAKQSTTLAPTNKTIATNTLATLESLKIDEEEGLTVEADSEQLTLLNSFYINDLEKALNDRANNNHPILDAFINGCDHKVDIQLGEHQSFLLEQLEPLHANKGRWPAPQQNMMSLMQQVCINQTIRHKNQQVIIATNGPPGTGKTTLLKDIIAEKIVQRATALAGFSSVAACFLERKKITLGDKDISLSTLKPELTGYEMLVVSSNNIAVENITRELPLKKGIAKEHQETCSYLRPIAAKLSANHFNQKITPTKMSQQTWGLIAVALGNSKNREDFVNKFFFSPDTDNSSAKRLQTGDYLTIWEWRNRYKGFSFVQAKTVFLHSLEKVTVYQKQLQELSTLHQLIKQNEWDIKIQQHHEGLSSLNGTLEGLSAEKIKLEHFLLEIEQQQQTLYRDLTQQLSLKPSFWQRLTRSKEAQLFKQLIESLQRRRLTLSEQLIVLQEQIQQINTTYSQLQSAFETLQAQLIQDEEQKRTLHSRYDALRAIHPEINIPREYISDKDHIIGYWQSEAFNDLRSQLFIHAMQLQEAWLAEALQKKYFGGNILGIQALLQGRHPLSPSDELVLWQSLFMIIPVVSSTFASIANQFKNLGPQSIGLLLIDEAGQAIPQAAIGALWRSKQVIVVGDPRQIEPILTIPPHLIQGFAKNHFSKINPYWIPNTTSVQKLADQASSIGSMMLINQQQEWIGIPLLVHRRCLEPMFSIANEIAYDNKMINARTNTNTATSSLPKSAWFDVVGSAQDKQFVPKQAECLLSLFTYFYNHDKRLPSLFIITPFKQVRKHLRTLIQNHKLWLNQINSAIPIATKKELQEWIRAHIGTVHTFQGKECEKVIFVLGTDKEQLGAIRWASSKPNLLNVALTRATDRIYLIGDWELWADKPFFAQASTLFERKKWNE